MGRLKIINPSKLNQLNDRVLIKNIGNSTEIKVPKKILQTFSKINEIPSQERTQFVDNLALAINYRGNKNISEAIEYWYKEGYRDHSYPQCKVNVAFDKIITVNFINLPTNSISLTEIRNLIEFFAIIPHGYDVTDLIRPHNEFQPVIT